MADSDAEWVGVDFEFGDPDHPTRRTTTTTTTTRRPRPRYPAATEPPHDMPEVAASRPNNTNTLNSGVIVGVVGGIMGVVLLGLLVYMLVLRKRLKKARATGEASKFQLRVADVAHLTHLDHTQATYVNTTDLQRFVAGVRAKGKGEVAPPTPPRTSLNSGFNGDSEVTVVRPPMPLPNNGKSKPLPVLSLPQLDISSPLSTESEALYCNLQDVKDPPPVPSQLPRIPPPPSPVRRQSTSGPTSPSVIARPAPPPPTTPASPPAISGPVVTILQANPTLKAAPMPPQNSKPILPKAPPQVTKPSPPPVAVKPSKPLIIEDNDSTPLMPTPTTTPTPPPPTAKPAPFSPHPATKPSPPTLPKPGVGKKGKALPPLKMALIRSRDSASCLTPDTAVMNLTPDTATSVTAKVAFLEGKVGVMPRRPAI